MEKDKGTRIVVNKKKHVKLNKNTAKYELNAGDTITSHTGNAIPREK